ncbi:MAG: YitT family protein [Selenomonadaceae bacterium]|nr:YitT family protein [Selenomonadaceae bacterium]
MLKGGKFLVRLTSLLVKWNPLKYLGIMAGCLIAASSINLFVVPSSLLTGGVTGIAIIFYFLTGLPIGMQTLAYNVPLLIASYKLLGKKYTIDVVIGTLMFSFALDATKFLSGMLTVDDMMLASIYGGIFNGIGYGIVFRMNGSTGGFDILGAIFKKYYSMEIGSVIFGFNCLIVVIAGALFSVQSAMFTLICMYVTSQMTNKVIDGFNQRKAILIVSDKAKDIAEGIIADIGRGVTFLNGEGAYTGDPKKIVMVVVSMTQIAKIKIVVNTVDRNAFMLILAASEVQGRGFTRPNRQNVKYRTDQKINPEVEQKIQDALANRGDD